MDFVVFVFIASIITLGLAAVQWGVDTRSLNVDPRYPSTNGLN